MSAAGDVATLLEGLGVDPARIEGGDLVVRTPITGEEIARVGRTDTAATDAAIGRATAAFTAATEPRCSTARPASAAFVEVRLRFG